CGAVRTAAEISREWDAALTEIFAQGKSGLSSAKNSKFHAITPKKFEREPMGSSRSMADTGCD
ncbi:MAG: hypothetical protein UGF45_06750, partial [Massilioclostridium sp.]|nr:hypothetical protein [Massilioclostridium sp.]